MKIQRRSPTFFNLSMVDILCCALGCVILLWLVYSREAKRRTAIASKVADELQMTKDLLDSAKNKYDQTLVSLSQSRQEKSGLEADLDSLRREYQDILTSLKAKKKAYDDLTDKMTKANNQIVLLQDTLKKKSKTLSLTSNKKKDLEVELLRFNKLIEELNRKLKASNQRGDDLSTKLNLSQKELRELAGKYKLSTKKVDDLQTRMAASNKLINQLQKLADGLKLASGDMSKKLASSKTANTELKKKLSASKTDLARLSKQMDELLKEKKTLQQLLTINRDDLKTAQASINKLQSDKSTLLQQRNMLHAAFSNRFAGMNLTGKKVVFLVDISGSMCMMDTKNLAPDKWPQVCKTLGKVMASLPNLTHYQVIAFSESVWYPLGREGQWIVYDPKTSVKQLVATMNKIKPAGGTKMRPAFVETFQKFGQQDLDTIYLISDGLPNYDDNLPKEAANLRGVQLTEYLSRRVRHELKTIWNRPVNGRTPVRINAIGYFFESPEVGAFLWALARENNGNFVGMSEP